MDVHISHSKKGAMGTTPWALVLAAGAGVLSFFVCRKLFKQTREAALLQTFIVASSTYGALRAAWKKECTLQLSDQALGSTAKTPTRALVVDSHSKDREAKAI